MEEILVDKDPTLCFTIILTDTSLALNRTLNETEPYYKASQELNQYFQQIVEVFGKENTPQKEKVDSLAKIYTTIFSKACKDDL